MDARTVTTIARGAPWPAIVGLTLCAGLVGGCAETFADRDAQSPLLAVAFALLAAASGFALDEPAAAVVDVTPTSADHVSAARAITLGVPCATGAALVLATTRTGGPSVPALLLTLAGSVLLGFTVADLARQWAAEPGALASIATTLLLIITPMLGIITRHVETFPTLEHQRDVSSNAFWTSVIAGCLIAVVSIARFDRCYRRGRRRRSRLNPRPRLGAPC